MKTKSKLGQFYTTNCDYILEGFDGPPKGIRCIIEPFVGEGHLVQWIQRKFKDVKIEYYDIDPKFKGTMYRDTLKSPPDYENTWVLTNPPFLARNKHKNKQLYDKYNTNDLYKCFLWSLIHQDNCVGGILIIPSGFFLSARDVDTFCRAEFMKRFVITRVKYFEERVFEDTSTTIVAFQFQRTRNNMDVQDIPWVFLPSNERRSFQMNSASKWMVGGDIYNLPVNTNIRIFRHVQDTALKENEQQTFLTLRTLDSGKETGRIALEFKPYYIYPAKESSRSYATLRIKGKILSNEEQIALSVKFNQFLEQKRQETCSLFLPQFRESKEYARKRLPFTLAYHILSHLLLE